MGDDKIFKGLVRGLGQLGVETVEKATEEGQKIVETIITGKELLGLERTMSDSQLEQFKKQEEIKSQQEINKLRGEVSSDQGGKDKKNKDRPRNVEEELTELRRQREKQEEEKERYYQQQAEKQRQEREKQQSEYFDITTESTNPSKQKKSRGSAFANKRKHKPDTDQVSATQEFNKGGKID